jgi:hypothetical protein
MVPIAPHVRHRGYFITETAGAGDQESGEHESPEGFTLRVCVARPFRQRMAPAGRAASPRASMHSVDSAHRGPAGPSPVRRATATGSHRR